MKPLAVRGWLLGATVARDCLLSLCSAGAVGAGKVCVCGKRHVLSTLSEPDFSSRVGAGYFEEEIHMAFERKSWSYGRLGNTPQPGRECVCVRVRARLVSPHGA